MKRMKKLLALAFALGLLLALGAQAAHAGPTLRYGNEGWLKFNYEMQLYGQYRDTGSGTDGTEDTSDIYFRRNRFSLMGQATKAYGFYFAIEHQGNRTIDDIQVRDEPIDRFTVLDAFLKASFTEYFNLRAGLTKDPLVREHNEGCFFPLSLDRSLFVYTSIPRRSRDFGVIFWGNLLEKKVQYKLSVMKGFDSQRSPESTLRYTARAHVSLLEPESIPVYFGSYLGKKKVLTFGAGYQIEPEAVFGNVAAQTMPKDYQAWTFDGFLEYPTEAGVFTASAAYLETDFEEAYRGADPDPDSIGIDGEKNGWYGKAGYMLPMKVGPGKVQFFGRYEQWNFAQLQGIFDQDLDWMGFGVNYLLKGHDLRLTLEYSMNDFEQEDADNEDFDTMTAMLQLRF